METRYQKFLHPKAVRRAYAQVRPRGGPTASEGETEGPTAAQQCQYSTHGCVAGARSVYRGRRVRRAPRPVVLDLRSEAGRRSVLATYGSPKWTMASAYSYLEKRRCASCVARHAAAQSDTAGAPSGRKGRGGNRRGPARMTRTHMYRCSQGVLEEVLDANGKPISAADRDVGLRIVQSGNTPTPCRRSEHRHSRGTRALRSFFFQCPYDECRGLFQGPKMFCLHMVEAHGDETYCPRCRRMFGSPVHCRAHLIQHHPDFVLNQNNEFIALSCYHQVMSASLVGHVDPLATLTPLGALYSFDSLDPQAALSFLDPLVRDWLSHPLVQEAPGRQEAVAVERPDATTDAAALAQQMQEAMDASDEEGLLTLCSSLVPVGAEADQVEGRDAEEIAKANEPVDFRGDRVSKETKETKETKASVYKSEEAGEPTAEVLAAKGQPGPSVSSRTVAHHEELSAQRRILNELNAKDALQLPVRKGPYGTFFFGLCFDGVARVYSDTASLSGSACPSCASVASVDSAASVDSLEASTSEADTCSSHSESQEREDSRSTHTEGGSRSGRVGGQARKRPRCQPREDEVAPTKRARTASPPSAADPVVVTIPVASL